MPLLCPAVSGAGTSGTSAERLRPGQIESRRRRAFVHYLRREVLAYSELHRRRFAAAGLAAASVKGPEDLARLPPMALGDVEDARDLVLRPTEAAIRRHGELELRWRLVWSKVGGRGGWVNEHMVDPRFKPVHWTVAAGVLVGWSADDLDRLGDLGRRLLRVVGLRRRDTLVTVMPMGPTLSFWQLALGARVAGISTVHVGRPADAASLLRMGPTSVAGRLVDLLALDGWGGLDGLRVVVVVGEGSEEVLDDDARAELAARVGGRVKVVTAWAPVGVRALWGECRPGFGVHTWPETEILQVGDDDEIVWTPVGWRGSVLLRMRTGAPATVEAQPCTACGRTTPRVRPRVPAQRRVRR